MPKMVFSDLYKSPKSPLSKLLPNQQHQQLQSQQQTDDLYGDPDLVSRDKAKQKEAVRRYLASKIRNDWLFVWPPPYDTEAASAAVEARAARVRARLVRTERAGLLDPSETFASPLQALPTATQSLAATSAAVAAAGATAHGDVRGRPGPDTAGLSTSNSGSDSDSDSASVYSTVSEDTVHFRVRAEWTSDVSDEENKTGMYYQSMPSYVQPPPCRYETPDSVGADVRLLSAEARQAKAQRDLKNEMVWNMGLACFTARRDAWTGARTVRVKPAEPCISPAPPVSPTWRRGHFRFPSLSKSEPKVDLPAPSETTPTASAQKAPEATGAAASAPLSPVVSNSQQSQQSRHSQQSEHTGRDTAATTPLASDGGADGALLRKSLSRPSRNSTPPLAQVVSGPAHPEYAVKTLIPIAPPLLPPNNPMRASIVPSIYLSLYDKVVLNGLQPSCPINLKDMIRTCVAGWKRDGEWPPRIVDVRPAGSAAATTALRKKMRDERRDVQKEKRDGGGGGGGGGKLPSPGFTRRMSSFLGRPLSATIVPNVVSTTTVTATGTLTTTVTGGSVPVPGPSPQPFDAKGADDGMDGSRGIRRSLQRVLNLGHAGDSPPLANAAGPVGNGA